MNKPNYKRYVPKPTIRKKGELPEFDQDFRMKQLNFEYYCSYPDHCIHYGHGSKNAFNISECKKCGFRSL